MKPLLYGDLVPWYRLIDPPEDHEEEATCYVEELERAVTGPAETLLELGAGAGNNALTMKRRFAATLTDISEGMQALSRETNPECEHHISDMRTLRLGREFDVVFVHDAVMYLTNEADLEATAKTAFLHTRSGGAALFAPDYVRETFRESSLLHGKDDGGRALRCLEWSWDPDPADDTFVTEFAFLLREGGAVRAVHDRHIEGMFPRATWFRVLEGAGYRVEARPRTFDDVQTDELFVCRKP